MAAYDDWAVARRQIEDSNYWISPRGRRPRWRKKIFHALLMTFDAALRLTPLHAVGRHNALDLQVRRHDIVLPNLPPEFDGYRLMHVSDTHLDECPELVDQTRALVAGLEVDLLIVTGDTLGHVRTPVGEAADLLHQALQDVTVRDGRLATLGNHDPVDMVAELRRIGFDVLVNRTHRVWRGTSALSLTGLDDVHSFYTPQALEALGPVDQGCAIALVHTSELADHAAAAGYSLYLAGHTHGGQIALPGGRPIITQLVRCRHTAVGLWRHDKLVGHTSSGLGVSGPKLRFNTRGEVALLTLRRPGIESA
ncbi:MAG TPA: metallophosphoesterase [Reyranella sp.]|nr:metallophosphoesterase [Reyranella sp.]